MSQRVAIGSVLFDSEDGRELKVTCPELDSKRKLTAQAGEGDDDGKLTRGGREVRGVKIIVEWPDRDDMADTITALVEAIDASRPTKKGEKPLPFAYERNKIDLARLKHISIVEIEETKGPTYDEEKGVGKYEIALKSASPAKQGKGAAANADGNDVAAWKDPQALSAKGTGYQRTATVSPTQSKMYPVVKP